ncbi:MAG TPA: hypothetical protein VGY66_22090 [Gemmataceae bacterium]|jgi:hypothetical protein|nr:hypothetical protein [Gemmataceae bacterium]
MTPKQAIAFVKANGIVLESGRGPVANLAEAIAGAPIRGSWWAHAKANTIFLCSRAIRESADVLVCRLVGGKVTYVHRRLWPALVRLAGRFDADQLAVIEEAHTPSGRHKVKVTSFQKWVPEEVAQAAARLTDEEANSLLPVLPTSSSRSSRRKGRQTESG